MMDKKSANSFSSKTGEGVPRKQLPYSVETPYGFHLDLDFLKYVDDIEKGNTIKRVHIHRRIKGPKFSTLPRNFSLPGHGVRPVPKDKDSWTATSTLGPKPKSRVTEVQQILDFRPSDSGSMQGSGYVTSKPRDEVNVGHRGLEERPLGLQSRPNLLRASSMPITVQHRKGSDSSSPDRVVVTPENGSSENVFRASPDLAERRSLPQDRTGLHQQITVALKRVRELEEQVKTIPELKAQICSLREERERLLLELQAKAKAQAQAQAQAQAFTNPRADSGTRLEDDQSSEGSAVLDQLKTSLESSTRAPVEENEGLSNSTVSQIDKKSQSSNLAQGEVGHVPRCKTQPSEKCQPQSIEHTGDKLPQDLTSQQLSSPKVTPEEAGDGSNVPGGQSPKQEELKGHPNSSDADLTSLQQLQHKLTMLDSKLTQASQELERTQGLLKEQIEDNKQKDVRILQLSEGVRVEVCTTQPRSTARRASVDRATAMERVGFANQETETECPGTVDQGTDTERICIEVCIPRIMVGSIHQQAELELVEAEAEVAPPVRQRANSVDQGTETERIDTQDQMTETPTADRVNQVTETDEGPSITNHPMRPRASSVDRGTETERVDTVDRVTETVVAPRTDQQTETDTQRDRRQNGNPVRNVEEQAIVLRDVVVTESGESAYDGNTDQDLRVVCVATDNLLSGSVSAVAESMAIMILDDKIKDGQTCDAATTEVIKDTKLCLTLQSDFETRAMTSGMVTAVEEEKDAPKALEQMETATDKLIVAVTTMVTDTASVAVVTDSSYVGALIPVRPQRGRTPTTEQSSQLQLQAPPVRPQRGSGDTLPQQAKAHPVPIPLPPAEEKALVPLQIQASPQPIGAASSENQNLSKTSSEPQSSPQIQAQSLAEIQPQPRKPSVASNDRQPQPKLRAQKKPPSPGSSDTHNAPQSQTSVSRRESKEPQPTRRRSAESSQPQSQTHPARRGSSETQPIGPPRGSGEKEPSRRGSGETQTIRRGSSEVAQHRGSTEAQALRREAGEAQSSRRGSGESPTSPAALGQVVTRLTGLLGEQWAQLGSGGSGAQQAAPGQQEGPSTLKQSTGKRAVPAKGTPAKPAGKAASAPVAAAAVAAGKPTGKAGPSKMSSIQSQLVSSLSVLSAFYSPAQKAAAAKKQQEQGLKSIMKKNGAAAKRSSGGAKKNLKFVGVNGGYESTSSEESSGDEKTMRKKKEERDEEEQEEKQEVLAVEEVKDSSAMPDAEQHERSAAAQQEAVGGGGEGGLVDLEGGLLQELQEEEQAAGGQVEQGFVDACIYVKDRMGEVSSPDKEMRQVLLVLYQEWFRVSSQRNSEADMVRLYLRQVSRTTPTLLPYVVNLTDGNGNTALHYSVSHSNFPVVRLLLDTGLCETDNVNKAGYTAVMLAALTAADRHDDLEVVLQLLRQGQVDARSSQAGQTALMLAVSHGRVAMVKLLLSCGADVNSQDRDGCSALMCASEHGHVHIARLLLETGCCDAALVDKDGQTAMMVATAAPQQEVVDLLKTHAETGAAHSTSSSSSSGGPPPPLS